MSRDSEVYKERKEALKGNNVVSRPLPRLADDIVPRKTNKGGRPKKYTPRRIKNKINKYFEWCEETDELPSISGMIIYLKMYPNQFYSYIKDPAFRDILEQARLVVKNWIESDVYRCTGKTDGKVAYMKNIHGWADKLDTNNVTEVKQIVSVDEARAKIEQLAPALLEVLKSNLAVNQIADSKDDVVVEAEVVSENRV